MTSPAGTTLRSYEYNDPGELITQIAADVLLTDNTAYYALVANPSTSQCIERLERLQTPAVVDDYHEPCDEMRDLIERWPVPDVVPPTHSTYLVLVRRGRCVFGPNEARWFMADRYLNHFQRLFTGDCALVTEHGWRDSMTDFAGVSPALPRDG